MFKVHFTFDRETKRTLRFNEDGPEDRHRIGVIYVKKSAFSAERHQVPNKITVSVEVD